MLASACQTTPYAPPPRPAQVDEVEVEVSQFEGRPEAYARVRGRLSSQAAQLIDPRQSRRDGVLYLEILEQTPRGAEATASLAEPSPFDTRVPIEILGLDPGPQRLLVNGHEAIFELPSLRAEIASPSDAAPPPRITLLDEFLTPGE